MIEIKEGESLLMDVPEVKKILRIGTNKTYDIIRENKIPYIKLGKQIKVYRKGFYEWLEKNIIT
jgi:excisionase family DNA binding protein